MANDDQPADDPWLTLVEIADELRLSPATIRSWIAKGLLDATRSGRRKWLVRRSELDRMLAREGDVHRQRATRQPGEPMLRRWPVDIVSPPGSTTWTPGERVDPDDWLGVAQWEWLAAVEQSRMAPPDAWFTGRLRHIADAAVRKAGALALFDDEEPVAGMTSRPRTRRFSPTSCAPAAPDPDRAVCGPGLTVGWSGCPKQCGLGQPRDSGAHSGIWRRFCTTSLTRWTASEGLARAADGLDQLQQELQQELQQPLL
ncbi:MAG: helix-turn-helix domain-containing protein [Solirubrobacteraceae bacterium]